MAKKKPIEKPIDTKLELVKEISALVGKMKGKTRASLPEIKQMFALYNKYYTTQENNYSCDLCAIRIYSKLKKISDNYVAGKRIS